MEEKYIWQSIHMHAHTVHSDASQTLRECAQSFSDNKIDAFFATDHNTFSSKKEIEGVEKEIDIKILEGIEYTTFYGHILSLGSAYTDWTKYGQNDIKEFIAAIKKSGNLACLAHPGGVGYPFSTGGRFTYDLDFEDYRIFDLIEIFNSSCGRQWEVDYKLWRKLLADKVKITAYLGIDAHNISAVRTTEYFNKVKIDSSIEYKKAVFQAIQAGRVIITKGAALDLSLYHNDKEYRLGDVVKAKAGSEIIISVNITFNETSISLIKKDSKYILELITASGIIKKIELGLPNLDLAAPNYHCSIKLPYETNMKYIGAQLHEVTFIKKEIAAITNSIYFA